MVRNPDKLFRHWEYQIDLLRTAEGRIAQQQIAFLREQAELSGEDPDEVAKDLTDDDKLVIRNWSQVGDWYALCCGDQQKVRELLDYLGVEPKDKRVEVPWPEDLRDKLQVLMQPRPNQVPVIEAWLKAGHGLLRAAPAFGKTFVMIHSIITRQQYTMFLVHTDALADQFITRFRHGSLNDDGGFTPITNCLAVEKELGREIVGRYRGPDELFPVTVATWQSFTSPSGKKALKTIGKNFGHVLADEGHVFAAPAPAGVVNGFHAKVRAAVSATPERKDQLDVALYDVVGPVTAEGKAEQLPVTGYLISTGCKYPPRKYPSRAEWARIINWLMKQSDRNDLILDWVKHDVEVEDRNVLILSDRVKWCLETAELLTKQGIPSRAVIGGMNSKRGLADRAKTIRDMMDRRIRVITATSVFKAGIDIPNLDTLYYVVPQNNEPQLQQAMGRIRRLYEDKKSAVFRYFVDEGHGLLFGCARGTHKALVREDIEVIMVPAGRKPSTVHSMRVFDPEVSATRAKGFKNVSSKQSSAMSDLFSDLRQEDNLRKQYNKSLRRGE